MRQYWASILFVLRFAPDDMGRPAALSASEEALIKALRDAPRAIAANDTPLPKRTSAMKLKSVRAERFRE